MTARTAEKHIFACVDEAPAVDEFFLGARSPVFWPQPCNRASGTLRDRSVRQRQDSRDWRGPRRKGKTSPCTNTRRGNEELRRSGLMESALTFDLSGLPKAGPLEGRVSHLVELRGVFSRFLQCWKTERLSLLIGDGCFIYGREFKLPCGLGLRVLRAVPLRTAHLHQ